MASRTMKTCIEDMPKGMKATVNLADPAYVCAYMNSNFIALQEEGDCSIVELVQMSSDAFEIAWLEDTQKRAYLSVLDSYATGSA